MVEIQRLYQLELDLVEIASDLMDGTVDSDAMMDDVVLRIVVQTVANMVMLDSKVAVDRMEAAAPTQTVGMEMVDRPINRLMDRQTILECNRLFIRDRDSTAAIPMSLGALPIPPLRVWHSEHGQCTNTADGQCPAWRRISNRSSKSGPMCAMRNSVATPWKLSRKLPTL